MGIDQVQRLALDLESRTRTAIVARVWLVDCVRTEALLEMGIPPLEQEFGDYSPGRFGWVFSRVETLDVPVSCPGRQGLWAPSDDVAARVADAAYKIVHEGPHERLVPFLRR